MTLFKKRRGIHIPYNKQGLIYFTCVNVSSKRIQDKIMKHCILAAGEDADALFRFLTDRSINHIYIELNYGINSKLLFKLKNKFFVSFNKDF